MQLPDLGTFGRNFLDILSGKFYLASGEIGRCLRYVDCGEFYWSQTGHEPLTMDVLVLCSESNQNVFVFGNLGNLRLNYFNFWHLLALQVHIIALFNSPDYLHDSLFSRSLLYQLFVGLILQIHILSFPVRSLQSF